MSTYYYCIYKDHFYFQENACFNHAGERQRPSSSIYYFVATGSISASTFTSCPSAPLKTTTRSTRSLAVVALAFASKRHLPVVGSSEVTRFSNNTGYWADEVLDETLLRFTDFTFQPTDGYLLVSDLQGERNQSGDFYLTDPVVHCTDTLRFGRTNLGQDCMPTCLTTARAQRNEKGWITNSGRLEKSKKTKSKASFYAKGGQRIQAL